MCILVLLLCFVSRICFFKQKTAYEMRISDWSSDVCSSDLKMALRVLRDTDKIGWQDFFTDARLRRVIDQALNNNRDLRVAVARVEQARALYREIGRASCRESVRRYV